MKIQVIADNRNIKILLPTGLIFSDLSAIIACKIIEKATITNDGKETLDPELKELLKGIIKDCCKTLRQTKKKYPGFVLVDVESSSGEKIVITL